MFLPRQLSRLVSGAAGLFSRAPVPHAQQLADYAEQIAADRIMLRFSNTPDYQSYMNESKEIFERTGSAGKALRFFRKRTTDLAAPLYVLRCAIKSEEGTWLMGANYDRAALGLPGDVKKYFLDLVEAHTGYLREQFAVHAGRNDCLSLTRSREIIAACDSWIGKIGGDYFSPKEGAFFRELILKADALGSLENSL